MLDSLKTRCGPKSEYPTLETQEPAKDTENIVDPVENGDTPAADETTEGTKVQETEPPAA